MTTAIYIEDLLFELDSQSNGFHEVMSWPDAVILDSIMKRLHADGQITQSQSNLVLKLLNRYKLLYIAAGEDYTALIDEPKWKSPFRKLDNTRFVSIVEDDIGRKWYNIKFPFILKDEFERDILQDKTRYSTWDSNTKLRKLPFYEFNIFEIFEFAQKHGFEIDESVVAAQNFVEEVLQQQDTLLPCSELINGQVILKNAVDDATTYWNLHKTDNVDKDIFLAKSMGFPLNLNNDPSSVVERICQSQEKYFWINSYETFFTLHKTINGITCIVLDRNTQNVIDWLHNFVQDAEKNSVDRSEIKVCFRESKDSNVPLNDWIKSNNLGGPVDGAKILIFKHKPAKWLFTNNVDVKIIVTNSYTPVNDAFVSSWLNNHHCRCYLGEIKPTVLRTQKIVSV
jgi:hypothetical protein